MAEAAVVGAQHHAGAVEQHDLAIDAGKGGERAIGFDIGHAQAPHEVIHAGTGRPHRDLARVAAAVLPARRVDVRELEGSHTPFTIGRFRPFSCAHSMAMS
ncbi:hypothetical protein D3C81_1640780 [compost metagenome]